jgi:hypothetical protein
MFIMFAYAMAATRLCNDSLPQCHVPLPYITIRFNTFGALFGACNKVSDEEYQTLFPYIPKLWSLLHIVPINWSPNSVLGCEKRIYGNVVLVNRTWNNCIQNNCWRWQWNDMRNLHSHEKEGDDLWSMAMANVAFCCGKNY